MTVCHNARKGCHTGSHWPNHVRASALLDVQRLQVKNPKSKFENSLMLTQLTTVKDRCGIALPAASGEAAVTRPPSDRKSTRLNSSHSQISYAVFCLKKKKTH